MRHPRFGDIVTNTCVSEDSPWKRMVFVELIRRRGRMNHGTWYRCTDGKGNFAEFDPAVVEVLEQRAH